MMTLKHICPLCRSTIFLVTTGPKMLIFFSPFKDEPSTGTVPRLSLTFITIIINHAWSFFSPDSDSEDMRLTCCLLGLFKAFESFLHVCP